MTWLTDERLMKQGPEARARGGKHTFVCMRCHNGFDAEPRPMDEVFRLRRTLLITVDGFEPVVCDPCFKDVTNFAFPPECSPEAWWAQRTSMPVPASDLMSDYETAFG